MDELILKTDTKMRKSTDLKMLLLLFIILSAVIWGFMWQAVSSCIATQVIIFAALAWTYYRSSKNGDVTLHFKGDSLEIKYGDGRKYNVKDVDRSFFTLLQTEKQKTWNIGTLSVQSTNFKVQYIKEFSSLRDYVNTHFEKKEKKSIYYFDEEDEK